MSNTYGSDSNIDYYFGVDGDTTDDEKDLDITDLDLDEILVPSHFKELMAEVKDNRVGCFDITDKDYIQFLRTYFSSFFARKMVSSFTKIGKDNQILSCNTNGSLLDESSSGYLVTALYTFKEQHKEYLDRLYRDLLLDNSRAVYLFRVTNLLTLINKYKEYLDIKRFSNTTIIGKPRNDEIEITKNNYVATLVTSQFILRNISNMYDSIADLQNREDPEQYTLIDIDVSKLKHVAPYIWYEIDTHLIGDQFKDGRQHMTLVWLDGMDIPSRREFLAKQKQEYRLQLVAKIHSDKYIKYGVEYEDENVLCTITRPNMILYPNLIA